MKKKKRISAVDILFFLGALLISMGVGLWICVGAGLISSGLFSLAASYLADKSETGRDGEP